MPLHNDKPNADRLDKLARPEVRAKLRAAQKAAWTRRPRASSSTVFSSTGKRLSPS